MTKEQTWKCLKKFSTAEQKEMALQLLKEFPEERLTLKYLRLL